MILDRKHANSNQNRQNFGLDQCWQPNHHVASSTELFGQECLMQIKCKTQVKLKVAAIQPEENLLPVKLFGKNPINLGGLKTAMENSNAIWNRWRQWR